MLSRSAVAMHSASWWSSPGLPGVEVSLHAHAGPLPPLRLFPMVQLKIMVDGEVDLQWGSSVWRQKPGDCTIVAPHCNFRVVRRIRETASTLQAFVAPHLFDAWMKRHGGPSSNDFRVRHSPDPSLGEALRGLEENLRNAAEASSLRAGFDRLMRSALGFLAANDEKGRRRPEICRVVEVLRDRFAESISLDQLTETAGLSKFHLIRLFRDEVGLAPHAFQLQLRISRARELLASGTSVVEVAAACGFADQAHFSRCFKRAVGYTPGAFQRLAD